MRTKDLIAKLQKMVDDHEPHELVMGDHEIVIDVFREVGEHHFQYAGFSPDIDIQYSGDGVYPILTAFIKEEENGI